MVHITRLARACAIPAVLFIAACSGGGNSPMPGTSGANATKSLQAASRDSSGVFTVSGQITEASYPNKPLIQAETGCGFLFVNITSSTKIVTDGSSISVGKYL